MGAVGLTACVPFLTVGPCVPVLQRQLSALSLQAQYGSSTLLVVWPEPSKARDKRLPLASLLCYHMGATLGALSCLPSLQAQGPQR